MSAPRILTSLLIPALLVAVGCEGEERTDGPRPVVKARKVIGERTQDVKKLETELKNEGGQVSDMKVVAKDPFTLSGNTYVSAVGRLSIDQITHALNLYKATNDRYPKDYEEFMAEIIRANNIALPQLPAYQDYAYDEKEHRLVVVEYPARKAELKRQFDEKTDPF